VIPDEAVEDTAHPMCRTERGHVCHEPSGRVCIEKGCAEPAGTWWGPYWCPEHDAQRLDGISASLVDIAGGMK
jgi:hypothetical protein